METTQLFRLVGTTDILEIPCHQDDAHNIIYWQDILDAFPGVQCVMNGNTPVNRLTDAGVDKNKPQRIRHYPRVVLDVVASPSIAIDPGTSSTTHLKLSAIYDRTSDPTGTSSEPPAHDNTAEAKQGEVKQLQFQALSQLDLLQDRVNALITRTYELREYPIPRLFVVLPQDTSSWDPTNLFSNKFRLYFLCECGEHTKSTNSKIPHHIHISKHEGYEISQPTEFFEQYGHYALTILRMFKFGISVAGAAIPTVSHLIRTDVLGEATDNLKALSGNIQEGMDQAIGCLEKITGDDADGSNGIPEQMENNKALEDADLRKLETFLNNKDENKVLGNLYRTVTSEGHVKWVCVDHYRENYHEEAVKVFCNTVESMGGSFDENIGRATVHLRSRTQAEQFYQALERSRSVFELDIALDWDTTQSDFKKLQDVVHIASIGALRIDLKHRDATADNVLDRSQRHDPILDIMRHPSTHSIAIIGAPKDFIELSSLQSRDDNFSNLRHLGIDLSLLKKDIPGIKALVSRAPDLSRLALDGAGYEIPQVYTAIAEHLTCHVTFDHVLRIAPPTSGSHQSTETAPNVPELFRLYAERIEVLDLDRSDLAGSIVDVFGKSKENRSSINELNLMDVDHLGDVYVKYVAIVVSRSELRSLRIHLRRGEERRIQILESIQWKHIREVRVYLDKENIGARAMKALVEGRDKVDGPVELDYFEFRCPSAESVSAELTAPLQSLLASTSIYDLWLWLKMTPSVLESMLNSADVSRLEVIRLYAKGYTTSQFDGFLDCLTNAHKLKTVYYYYYTPTQEQIQRMQARGVRIT